MVLAMTQEESILGWLRIACTSGSLSFKRSYGPEDHRNVGGNIHQNSCGNGAILGEGASYCYHADHGNAYIGDRGSTKLGISPSEYVHDPRSDE